MKKYALLTGLLIVVLAIFLTRTPDTSHDAMVEKYTNEASRFLETDDGFRIHYRDQGNPHGETIVFLHGAAASLHTWEPLVERLGKEYRIITYTQPGHGLTGPHPRDDYSFSGMAEALDHLTRELNLPTFVLGGNSLGGWVSWRYALDNPERVKALLLLNAAGMPLREGEKIPSFSFRSLILQNPVGRFAAKHFIQRSIVEASALQSVSIKEVMAEHVIDRYWELLRYPGNRRAAILRAIVDREAIYAERLGDIPAPTLVIWGAEDQRIFPSAAKTFSERLSEADVVVYEGIGHLPMEEAPDRTAQDIDAFLERMIKRSQ